MADYVNPASAAQPYMDKIPGIVTPYYQPYVDAGQSSLSTLIGQYNTLLNNPGQVINNAGSGYQESPGYQYEYNSAMNAQNNQAAAGGYLGTPAAMEGSANAAADVANQDYEEYLNQALGLYGKGLSGYQDLNTMGYKASDDLATALATNMSNEAGMAYAGQQGENAHNEAEDMAKKKSESDFWSSIWSAGGEIGSAALKYSPEIISALALL